MSPAGARDGPPDHQEDDRADERDQNASYVDPGNSSESKCPEYPAAYDRADYTCYQVSEYSARTRLLARKDRACQETCYQTDYNPSQYAHRSHLLEQHEL